MPSTFTFKVTPIPSRKVGEESYYAYTTIKDPDCFMAFVRFLASNPAKAYGMKDGEQCVFVDVKNGGNNFKIERHLIKL